MSQLSNITGYANATPGYFEMCYGNWEGIAIWMGVSIASFFLGFPPAVAILWEMFQRKRRGTAFTPHDVFVLNLAIMDAVYLFFILPEVYNYLFGRNLVYEHLISFMFSFNVCGKPLFITCICLDCFLAVVFPVTYRVKKSLTPRILMTAGVWAVTFAYGCSFALASQSVFEAPLKLSMFTLTLPVIAFCDVSILWTLKRSERGGRGLHPQKKRALQIIVNNLVISFVTYAPSLAVYVMSNVLSISGVTYWCLVAVPVMSFILTGNALMSILHAKNLGKLNWLKCRKKK